MRTYVPPTHQTYSDEREKVSRYLPFQRGKNQSCIVVVPGLERFCSLVGHMAAGP